MSAKLDLTGKTYGRLYVESFAFTKDMRTFWNCVCGCGNKCVIKGKYLTNGDTKSCGCLNNDKRIERFKNNIKRNRYEQIDNETIKVYYNNTNNYFICDTDDWNVLKKYTWHENKGHYARTVDKECGKQFFFHDAVMNFTPSRKVVCDHINRDRSNNKKSNLRIVEIKYNSINRKKHINNTSGETGVYRINGRWNAKISNIDLGTFDTIEEAKKAREEAENKYFEGIIYHAN